MKKRTLVIVGIVSLALVVGLVSMIHFKKSPKADTTGGPASKTFRVLSGVITTASGQPASGVIISVGDIGTVTDASGNYSLILDNGIDPLQPVTITDSNGNSLTLSNATNEAPQVEIEPGQTRSINFQLQ